MSDLILKMFRAKSQQEVARDYFIYYVMQHESCLAVENSKKFVLVPSWLAKNEPGSSYRQALETMTDWYWENFSVLAEDQMLNFDNLYRYVPTFLAYLGEARHLWQELQGKEPPAYHEDAEFWRELVTILRRQSKHQHLLLPYLQWRYGDRIINNFPRHNFPPNPFITKEQSFGRRQDYRPRQQQSFRDRSEGRRPSERKSELTAEMRAEIESAIALLREDRQQREVILKPTNSYLRRLQHKMIANLGFGSISINQDQDRAVKVVRKKRRQRRRAPSSRNSPRT